MAAERQLGKCNAQELANTAWAFATVRMLDEKLFAALEMAAERRLSEFNVQAPAKNNENQRKINDK